MGSGDFTFQSTRPCGPRPGPGRCNPNRTRFNPRGRAGRDMVHDRQRRYPGRFNPRGRAGRDSWGVGVMPMPRPVSIHAAVRAATSCGCKRSSPSRFQSTRPCGPRRLHCKGLIGGGLRVVFRGTIRDLDDLRGWRPSLLKQAGSGAGVRKIANQRGNPCALEVRVDYTISGPSTSKLGFAPTCSTRRFQLAPRK